MPGFVQVVLGLSVGSPAGCGLGGCHVQDSRSHPKRVGTERYGRSPQSELWEGARGPAQPCPCASPETKESPPRRREVESGVQWPPSSPGPPPLDLTLLTALPTQGTPTPLSAACWAQGRIRDFLSGLHGTPMPPSWASKGTRLNQLLPGSEGGRGPKSTPKKNQNADKVLSEMPKVTEGVRDSCSPSVLVL